ncbi:MAG TPA: histidine--tRNA ligase [Actinobacteria bacterium]|nr:histidine--tRNA ligase [Actinomycetota bacterium]
MNLRAPKGTDDVFPPESRAWRRLLRTWDDLSERYGYELVMTPSFEHTEVFARGVGEATEVVEKQMYTFEDKGGRSLTLRPENTAGVVRAYIQNGRTGVFKGAYSGAMYRYERPQEGRRRQFWQLGVEYLGESHVDADLEVIELGYRFLLEAGLGDIEVLVNSIGDPADRVAYNELLTSWLTDRADLLSSDARGRIESNPLRVLDSKVDGDVLGDSPTPADHLSEETAAHYAALVEGLEAREITYRKAPRLVRGLDYYNRTVFEYVPKLYAAAQNTVGGGGRYDGLAELLGGRHLPATGLALGLDRILVALGDRPPPRALDVFLVIADPSLRAEARDFARRLRDAGVRTDFVAGERSVKAQFKAADRRDAAVVAVIGEEWSDGKVTVKDLSSGEERLVVAGDLPGWMDR